ncbi:MAG: N-acetyltransferase family protein [Methylocystaceae bacterium]
MKIRSALAEDALTISQIHASSWKAGYRGIVPQQYLDDLSDQYWVTLFQKAITEDLFQVKLILEDNIPVGCISYGKARDKKLSSWAEIIALYIHPNYFRRGYGQRLLNTAFEELKSNSYKSCYLWVLKENTNARYFYEKNGFHCSSDENNVEVAGEKLIDVRYIINFE